MAKEPPDPLSQTLADDGSVERPQLDIQVWLLVVHGSDCGKHIKLEEPSLTLGRSPEANVVLNDTLISRVHCTVLLTAKGEVKVLDHQSRNGMFVDDKRVKRATLTPQSLLRIGHTVLRVEHKATEEVEVAQELLAAATTDELTGAPNRKWFMDRARAETNKATQQGRPLSVAFLDIDHFKKVNDTYGHSAGDDVLRDVADRLRDGIRAEDLWCRYGGEEFVVLLPTTPMVNALIFCERIRNQIADTPSRSGKQKIPVTVSIGVTEVCTEDTLETLLERADQALYRAKNQGRNCVVSDP